MFDHSRRTILFIVVVVLEHFRIAVAAGGHYLADVFAGVLDEFAARRANSVAVIAMQIVRRCSLSIGYELDGCRFAAHPTGDGAAFCNFSHIYSQDSSEIIARKKKTVYQTGAEVNRVPSPASHSAASSEMVQ